MSEPNSDERAKYLSSSSPQTRQPVRYSFCESVHATGSSPWHIRQLDSSGPKYTGGITTESLCTLVTKGWDVKASITEHHLGHACKRCVSKYREQTAT